MRIKENILSVNARTGDITLGGESITKTELETLAGEIYTLKQLRIWSIFQNSIREYAIQKGFLQATTLDQFKEGKMLEYAITMMETIVDKIEKLNQKLNKK